MRQTSFWWRRPNGYERDSSNNRNAFQSRNWGIGERLRRPECTFRIFIMHLGQLGTELWSFAGAKLRRQFMDAVAVAMITPGRAVITVGFIAS